MLQAPSTRKRLTSRLTQLSASPAFLLFVGFACLYLLTCQGRINTYDGQSMFATTRALGDRLSLSLDQPAFGVLGRGGRSYSKYGIAQSLAEEPLYLLGKLLGLGAPAKAAQIAELLAMLTNPLIMAATCVLFYWLTCALGFTRATAVRATLALGLATSLWPYAKSDFSEPLLTAALLAATLCVTLASQDVATTRWTIRWDTLAGVALSVAVLTKYAALAFTPLFCLYLFWSTPRAYILLHRVRRLALLLAPVLVAGCVSLLINWLRFGSVTTTGYAAGEHPFSSLTWRPVWGLLLSPYRGLLFYDPLLFVGLLLLPVLLVRWRSEALLPLGVVAISLLEYGTYFAWDAGPAWGPRYLVPMLPFLLWPLLQLGCFGPAESLSGTVIAPGRGRKLAQSAAIGLAVISGGIQALGVCMNYYVHDLYWQVGQGIAFVSLKSSLAASPLAMSLWSLPMSLHYAFTAKLPAHGYASADYPFGPPLPTNPHMPQALGAFYVQSFWFTLLPHPALMAAIGALIFGVGMLLCGVALRRTLTSGD